MAGRGGGERVRYGKGRKEGWIAAKERTIKTKWKALEGSGAPEWWLAVDSVVGRKKMLVGGKMKICSQHAFTPYNAEMCQIRAYFVHYELAGIAVENRWWRARWQKVWGRRQKKIPAFYFAFSLASTRSRCFRIIRNFFRCQWPVIRANNEQLNGSRLSAGAFINSRGSLLLLSRCVWQTAQPRLHDWALDLPHSYCSSHIVKFHRAFFTSCLFNCMRSTPNTITITLIRPLPMPRIALYVRERVY